MKAARAKRRPEFTLEVDQFIVSKGPPGGLPLSTARNGKRKRALRQKHRERSVRLQPLVSRIGNCIMLAQHIDPKGLEDVVEALHRAYSNALDHQFNRR